MQKCSWIFNGFSWSVLYLAFLKHIWLLCNFHHSHCLLAGLSWWSKIKIWKQVEFSPWFKQFISETFYVTDWKCPRMLIWFENRDQKVHQISLSSSLTSLDITNKMAVIGLRTVNRLRLLQDLKVRQLSSSSNLNAWLFSNVRELIYFSSDPKIEFLALSGVLQVIRLLEPFGQHKRGLWSSRRGHVARKMGRLLGSQEPNLRLHQVSWWSSNRAFGKLEVHLWRRQLQGDAFV